MNDKYKAIKEKNYNELYLPGIKAGLLCKVCYQDYMRHDKPYPAAPFSTCSGCLAREYNKTNKTK
jgi:hypothetical protein